MIGLQTTKGNVTGGSPWGLVTAVEPVQQSNKAKAGHVQETTLTFLHLSLSVH